MPRYAILADATKNPSSTTQPIHRRYRLCRRPGAFEVRRRRSFSLSASNADSWPGRTPNRVQTNSNVSSLIIRGSPFQLRRMHSCFFAFALPGLQAFDFGELARRVLIASQLLVPPRQQIVGLGFLRLASHCRLQYAHCFCRLTLLEQDAPLQCRAFRRFWLFLQSSFNPLPGAIEISLPLEYISQVVER